MLRRRCATISWRGGRAGRANFPVAQFGHLVEIVGAVGLFRFRGRCFHFSADFLNFRDGGLFPRSHWARRPFTFSRRLPPSSLRKTPNRCWLASSLLLFQSGFFNFQLQEPPCSNRQS